MDFLVFFLKGLAKEIQTLGEMTASNFLQLKGDEGPSQCCLVLETGKGAALGRKRLWDLEVCQGLQEVTTLTMKVGSHRPS